MNIESVKQQVKTHTIRPFTVGQLTVTRDLGGNDRLSVDDSDFYISRENTGKLLSVLGIKETLKKKSFADPEARWNVLRSALQNCTPDRESQLAAIVNSSGTTINIINTPNRESRELDFDNRIDLAVDTIDATSGHELNSINFTTDGRVRMTTRDSLNEVDCGGNDIWQSGIEVDLGYNKQEFSAFYLRLICANGMTTSEKTARRQVSVNNISNQLTRFIAQHDFTGVLASKVNMMRDEYASVHEALQITNSLAKADREKYTPWYDDLCDTYSRAGRPLNSMSAKQQKLAFTDQNLYDVFNTGTYLATHKSDELGESTCMGLNQACANMFKAGPNLKLRTLDPYKLRKQSSLHTA